MRRAAALPMPAASRVFTLPSTGARANAMTAQVPSELCIIKYQPCYTGSALLCKVVNGTSTCKLDTYLWRLR